ncbi:MAG: GIY-YIG nuclease family protein [Shimia thalassica]|uniref:GIY-YIG nuclease family protein n=1 Tax=Shimia thalassica TaxID=1715693 RepID=UPI003299E823
MKADQVAAKQVLEPAKLIRPADILAHIEEREVTHGLYGWWFDDSLPEVPRGECLGFDGKHLLYIGIAPPKDKPTKPGSATPVKRRLWRNHLRGSVRSSTLRLSLAALLEDQLGFEFYRDAGDRVRMTKDHEERLTAWIVDHAGISVVHHDAPWQLEEALVRNGPPLPLNLSMSGHPFKPTLSALRKTLGRD